MTAKTAALPYLSGFCGTGGHDRCQGVYAGCDCTCPHHAEPEEPEPVRPRLLDLFCGAGGCSVGYHRAGFDVIGVDLEPHPDYPFPLTVADALTVLADAAYLSQFAVIHASPPCQAHTNMSNRWRGQGTAADAHTDLISDVRGALLRWGGVYVIENVPGAPMVAPLVLHGGMFGLGVYRPRLFESNAPLMIYKAPAPRDPLGIYGREPDGRRLWTRTDGSELRAAASVEEARVAMGCDWMTDFRDVAEAVPPAYTQFLGEQLLAHAAAPPALVEVGGAA